MAFRIQDLMTDVLPSAVRWASCPGGTTCRGDGFAAVSGKGGKTPPCRPVSHCDSPRPRPRPGGAPPDYTDLNLLHRQLQKALDGARA